jgi:hypothetical protein
LRYYKVSGAQRFSVSSDPMVPEALVPAIKAIHGLHTSDVRTPHHIRPQRQLSPEYTYAAGTYYIAPTDFATIYDLPANLTGAGVTIGIVSLSRISPISTTSAS